MERFSPYCTKSRLDSHRFCFDYRCTLSALCVLQRRGLEQTGSEYVLELVGQHITSLNGDALGALSQLRSLNLAFNHLRSIEGLDALTDLRELKLYGNQLSEVQGISKCVDARARIACEQCMHRDCSFGPG